MTDPASKEKAMALIKEWNYNGEGRIPLGATLQGRKDDLRRRDYEESGREQKSGYH